MRTLYHLWLSPFSRKVRLVLGEKKLPFELQFERTWERRPEFLAMNPAGKVPVLADEDGAVIADSYAICEYLEERYPDPSLLGASAAQRAETRRLAAWFDTLFHEQVSSRLVGEKVGKKFLKMGEPSSDAIRSGCENIHAHLDYIAYLAEQRNWLAGETVSLADLAAGAHLSCCDYLGDVPWGKHPGAKEWYARLKSRPAFRPLLADFIPGLPPPRHYADLDF
jgi:glutathione S-transferase